METRRPTKDFSHFIHGLTLDKIPQATLQCVKTSFLDSIGDGVYGASTRWSGAMSQFIQEQGGPQDATLWTTGFRGPAANVALGVGTMIHSFEMDDYHSGAKLHPSAAVVPAALAVGEKLGVSGNDLLLSLVAGFETMIRISLGTGTVSARLRGWHLTGTCGTFGAAAAAGKLLGLTEDQLTSALGLAGTQSAGLMAFTADGTDSKRLHPGKAAQSGIYAAELAKRGFTGPSQILEYGDGGFCRASSDNYDLDKLTERLGEYFVSGDISLKPYACCGSLHSSIDCAFEMVKRHKFSPDDIAKVIVHNSHVVKIQCDWDYVPISAIQAQMNIRYCVAVAIAEGKAFFEQFSDAMIFDPRLVALAGKVEFVIDPEIDVLYPTTFPGKLEIILKNGDRHIHSVPGPKGSPQNPMTWAEVTEKAKTQMNAVLAPSVTESVIEMVTHLENLKDIRNLTALLS